jgi:hypothetical protein
MHIILGEPNAVYIEDRYTLLPLDKFKLAQTEDATQSYCVIDKDSITVDEANRIDELGCLHQKLMENYYKKNWNYCEQALEHLRGSWKGTVDTFYDEIESRVTKYKEQDPGDDWDGIINKY